MSVTVTNNSYIAEQHQTEVAKGERFEFGRNWSAFLSVLDETRIAKAEESLKEMLECENLNGKTFLDIGSGSGLFSLAARRLGAKVHSFDFDSNSYACTKELRRRYFGGDTIQVAKRGTLFIAIYNDTGSQANRGQWIKKTYCRLPRLLKTPFAIAAILPDEAKSIAKSLITLKPMSYVRSWTQYKNGRGMNRWYDIIDWVGGYPYEVATVDEIFDFYRKRGFSLAKVKSGGVGLGCNEFVFEKKTETRS